MILVSPPHCVWSFKLLRTGYVINYEYIRGCVSTLGKGPLKQSTVSWLRRVRRNRHVCENVKMDNLVGPGRPRPRAAASSGARSAPEQTVLACPCFHSGCNAASGASEASSRGGPLSLVVVVVAAIRLAATGEYWTMR